MDVGDRYIVFGANTGSLYFFNRAALRFLQLVSSPEIRAPVTHIRFSPDERFVALSTLDGELVVLEPKLGTRAKERIVLRHHLHRDAIISSNTSSSSSSSSTSSSSSSLSSSSFSTSILATSPAASSPSLLSSSPASSSFLATSASFASLLSTSSPSSSVSAAEGGVTCLTWAPRGPQEDENYLFSSDTTGAIIITPVVTSLIKRSLLLASSGPEPLYKADSRVVQLDCTSVAASTTAAMKLQLLISTLTKSILLTIDTNAKQITGLQVGSKPRKGNYGACFSVAAAAAAAPAPSESGGPPRTPTILCAARPGRRIWLADAMTATVRKTLNFSTSLELLPAFPTSPATNLAPRPKLVTFGKLTTFGDGDYLLSWDDDRTKAQHALCLIDVQKVEIRAWTCFAAIRDLCVLPQEGCVYVLHEASEAKGGVRTLLSKICIPLSHSPSVPASDLTLATQSSEPALSPAVSISPATSPRPSPRPSSRPSPTPAPTPTAPAPAVADPLPAAPKVETPPPVEEAPVPVVPEVSTPAAGAVDTSTRPDEEELKQEAAVPSDVDTPRSELGSVGPVDQPPTSPSPPQAATGSAEENAIKIEPIGSTNDDAPIEQQRPSAVIAVAAERASSPPDSLAPIGSTPAESEKDTREEGQPKADNDVPEVGAVGTDATSPSEDASTSAPSPLALPPMKVAWDTAESEASAALPGGDADDAGVDAPAPMRRIRTSEDGLVTPRARKKTAKRRTARIEEAATKSPIRAAAAAAAEAGASALHPQVRPAASTLREILSSSSSSLPLSSNGSSAAHAPSVTPVTSHSAPSSPSVPVASQASASSSTLSLSSSNPESLADVTLSSSASSSASSSSSSSSLSPWSSASGQASSTTAADSTRPLSPAPGASSSVPPPATGADEVVSDTPAALPAGSVPIGSEPAVASPESSGEPSTTGGSKDEGSENKDKAAGGGGGLMSTKTWKEEIQSVGRRAMQLGKTPVNLDEIFQKPSLNFFKKSTGEKDGTTPDAAAKAAGPAATDESQSPSGGSAVEKEKAKKQKEKEEKEEKEKKDKVQDKEGPDKTATGIFKRAAATLLESSKELVHQPGSVSSSDVAGLFKKAKALVTSNKSADAVAGPLVTGDDVADDPQKAFWQLTKSLFEALASSVSSSNKFVTETRETMKEWVEEWSGLAAPPEGLPPAWITEILTSCFEQHILPSSLSTPAIPAFSAVDNNDDDDEDEDEREEEEEDRAWKMRERDLMTFLDRYFALLDHDRVLFFCNAHRLSLCISFFLHTEQILLHQTAALTPATPSTAAAQYLVQLWQALEDLLQPRSDAEKEEAAVEEALAVLRKADNNLSLVLRFLPSLYAKSPRVTAQYAATLYPFVRSWNVRSALPPSPVVTASSSPSLPLSPPFSASAALSTLGRKSQQRRSDEAMFLPSVKEIGHDERWTVYADYLEGLVDRHDECRRDPRIVHELFECALHQGVEVASLEFGRALRAEDRNAAKDDGRTSRNAHLVWKRGLFFDDEGRPLASPRDLRWKRDGAVLLPIALDRAQRKYSYRPRRLLHLAKRYGHFEAVKELALRVDDVPTALEVGVFTDDWGCVSRLTQRHSGDSWLWHHLLAFAAALWRREGRLTATGVTRQEKSESEDGEKTNANAKTKKSESVGVGAKAQPQRHILLEDVVAHMIKALGPIPAFEMIAGSQDLADLASAFPPVAYRHFIHAINVDIQHKELVYWMLKRVLEDLWLDKHTKRPPTIAPQFRAVKDAEAALQLDALPFLHRLASPAASALGPREKASAAAPNAVPVQPPNEKKFNIGFDYTTPTPRFFEEMTGHWGLRQQLVTGSCECCTLPLAESVGRSSTIVVFECGHGFHEFCVPEDSCPVCLTFHMPSLSSFLSP